LLPRAAVALVLFCVHDLGMGGGAAVTTDRWACLGRFGVRLARIALPTLAPTRT